MKGRKSSYSAAEVAFIEANYMSMTDKELSLGIESVFERKLTAGQIKRFRERSGLSRYSVSADKKTKSKEEAATRVSVRGAVTTHRCL